MSEEILETSDYSIFEVSIFNRNVERINSLEKSMSNHGWLSPYPMHVGRAENGRHRIKDGHHRFQVAQKLGMPVKYVICNDNVSTYELEQATNPWDLKDYLDSFCRTGNTHYLKIKEYHDATSINLSNCIAMMAGQGAGCASKRTVRDFKQGAFRISNSQFHPALVAQIVMYCKKCGIGWAGIDPFVKAISKIVRVPKFDVKRLKAKIKTFPYIIKKQESIEAYLEMLQELYNYKHRSKIPLKFLAGQLPKVLMENASESDNSKSKNL